MKKQIAALLLTAFIAPGVSLAAEADSFGSEQWYLDEISYERQPERRRTVVVAIVDSGVDTGHEDLVGRIWVNDDEVAGNGIDDDGNGYIDDVNGYDFVSGDSDPSPDLSVADSNPSAVSHGTLIAGIVAAQAGNGRGVTGIATNVRIMPLRVLDEFGSGGGSNAEEAIRYAVDNGADIINLSFSGDNDDNYIREALEYAYASGAVVVAAAGNDARNLNEDKSYPVCTAGEERWVLGVAATNRIGKRASFSNYGESCVDISAPGDDIFGILVDNQYAAGWNGTSVAAPMVAAVAAELRSLRAKLTFEEIRTALQNTAQRIPLNDGALGAGILNMREAIEEGESIFLPKDSPRYIEDALTGTRYALYEDDVLVAPNNKVLYTHTAEEAVLPVLYSNRVTGILLPKAGTALVQIPFTPQVYWLEVSEHPLIPKARIIEDEAMAVHFFGENWQDSIIEIEPAIFSQFREGLPLRYTERIDISNLATYE